MDLQGPLVKECETYLQGLQSNGLQLSEVEDHLVFPWNVKNEVLCAKLAYEAILTRNVDVVGKYWLKKLWNWHAPQKLKYFVWPSLANKILTSKNLLKRDFVGHGYCYLCRVENETISHLFV